jgi:ABC-2 type transport system permease protein
MSSSDTVRPRLLTSEVVKLVTLRSVWITALVTAVTCIGAAALLAPSVGEAIVTNDPALAPGTVPESVGLEWISLGLIGVLVIGVNAGSSEYTGGQLKTSLLAVPHRLALVLTKALALFLTTLILAAVTIPGLSILSQVALGDVGVLGGGVPASLIWRWIGGIAYWAAMAQIGFALGLLMRQSLIPLFVLIILSQIILVIVYWFPFLKYLPDAAGAQLFDPGAVGGSDPHAVLSPTAAAATLAAWVIVLVGAAVIRFRRRDANS